MFWINKLQKGTSTQKMERQSRPLPGLPFTTATSVSALSNKSSFVVRDWCPRNHIMNQPMIPQVTPVESAGSSAGSTFIIVRFHLLPIKGLRFEFSTKGRYL